MFAIPPNGYKTTENLEGKRHCILVAASNPFPLPVPVCRPNFGNCGDPLPTYDVVSVAGWFVQCCVSLSVICPWKSSKIRELYEAGKRNPNSEDQPVNIQHPNFLVMISEDFKVARVALSSTMLASYNNAVLSLPDSEAATTYQPANPAAKLLHMSYGNISPTNVEMDPAAIFLSTPDFCPSAPSIPYAAETLNMLGCQASTPSLVHMSPLLITVLNNAGDVLHAQENALLAFRDLASLGSQSTDSGNFSNMSPVLQTAVSTMVSGFEVVTGTLQHVRNSAVSSESSITTETKLSSLDHLHPSSNLQGSTTVIMEPTEASFNQVNPAQLEGSVGLNLVTNTNFRSIDVASSSQIPALERAQELNLGKQPDGLNCCAVSKPVSQETPGHLPLKQFNYVKVWEGKLFAPRHGKAVFITLLEAYKKGSTSTSLGADWPDYIQIVRLMLLDRIKHEYHKAGKGYLLVFRVINQHPFIRQLFEKKLCAVVELPSQKLVLAVSDKQTRLIGLLFPKVGETSSASAAVVEQQQPLADQTFSISR